MEKNKGFTLIELLATILIVAIIAFIIASCCTGCNKQMFDFDYSYDKAICFYGDEKFELKVDKWKDYDGEQLQIKSNGVTYLLSANNCYLIDE